jgi:type IV secretory pathway TraG/TraD family ATPase VirD4
MIDHRMMDQPHGLPGRGRVPVPRRRANGLDALLFLGAVFVGLQAGTEVVAYLTGFAKGPGVIVVGGFHAFHFWDGAVWFWHDVNSAGFKHGTPALRREIGELYTWGGVGACVGWFAALMAMRPLRRDGRPPGILGDAEFAGNGELRRWGYFNGRGMIVGTRIVRSVFDLVMPWRWVLPKRVVVRDNSEAHTMFAVGTGGGKDFHVITPTLLDDVNADASFILHDPPGESWGRLAGTRRGEFGNYTFRCAWGKDPDLHPDVAPWNVFWEIPRGTKRDLMVTNLISNKHVDRDGAGLKGKNAFFYSAAINIANLVTLAHVYGESEGLTCSGRRILDTITREMQSFGQMLDFFEGMDHSCGGKFRWFDPLTQKWSNKHPAILRLIGVCRQIKDEELESVFVTFFNGFAMYANPIIAENTETSAFSVRRIMDDERPYFITVEADVEDEETLSPLHALLYETALAFNQSSESLALDKTGRTQSAHKRDLFVCLNEKFSLGKVKAIERGATTARKFGIHIVPFYQAAGQNEAVYGQNNSLEGLMTLKVYSAQGSERDKERVSGALDTQTIAYDTDSISPLGQVSYSGHLNSAPLLRKGQIGKIPATMFLCDPIPTARVPADKSFVVYKFMEGSHPLKRRVKRRARVGPPPLSDRRPAGLDVSGVAGSDRAEELRAAALEEQLGDLVQPPAIRRDMVGA